MKRTRIIIGITGSNENLQRSLIYLGESGSQAEAAMNADTSAERYEIFEGPGRRKNNSNFQPAADAPAADAPASRRRK